MAKWVGVSEFHRTVTIRKTALGRPPPTGYYTDSRLRHNPRVPVGKAYLLGLERQPEG